MNDGRLYCGGNNNNSAPGNGSFGNGTNTPNYTSLTPITVLDGAVQAVGNYYLSSTGILYGTGNNTLYQLGNGSTTSTTSLQQLSTDVTFIESGYQVLYYMNAAGEVYSAGTQFGTQYGDETGQNGTSTATVLRNKTLIRSGVQKLVTCVGNMACHVIDTSNSLYSTGNNTLAQLGVGDQTPRYVFTSVRALSSNAVYLRCNLGSLLYDGSKLYYCGRNDVAMGGSTSAYTTILTEIPMTFIE